MVTIEEFRDRSIPMLMDVAPAITHLALREHAGESREVRNFLPRCIRLVSFNLHSSKSVDIEILQLLPRLRELNLTDCKWLEDRIAGFVFHHVPGLRILNVSENPQLGYDGFRGIATQTALEILNCTYCTNFEDGFLAGIARSCPAITELNISWCPKLTDAGMRILGSLRPSLKEVDISHCVKVSDAGLHDLARPLYQLERLVMQHLPLVSEDGILDAVALSPNLKYLDIRLCHITEAGVELIRKRWPNLELVFGEQL